VLHDHAEWRYVMIMILMMMLMTAVRLCDADTLPLLLQLVTCGKTKTAVLRVPTAVLRVPTAARRGT
jgi:hypothetical protein